LIYLRTWTTESKKLVELSIQALLCANPSEVSFLYWVFYMKSGNSFERLAGASNGAQESKISGGAQQISIELAKKVAVEYEAVVQTLRLDRLGSGATIVCRDGRTFKARYVILALSPTLWKTLTFEPPLPDLHNQLSQRMPMGTIIKTIMFYENAFWRTAGHRVSTFFFSFLFFFLLSLSSIPSPLLRVKLYAPLVL
jgi:monoamine oxidase